MDDQDFLANDDDDDYDYERTQRAARNLAALRAPVTYNIEFEKLFNFMEAGIIDLEAPYQREVVWNDGKQGHLIDSLVKNYYVPPAIFSIRENPLAEHDIRMAIDGKQRLTSIHNFMHNRIPQIDSADGMRIWFSHRTRVGAKNRVMTELERKEFKSKILTCVEYRQLSEEQEQEIFRRVQLGMALSTAEKLFANPGPLADFVRELMDTFKDLCSMVDSKRKVSFQILLQVYLTVVEKPRKICSAKELETKLSKREDVEEKDQILLKSVLDIFTNFIKKYPDVWTTPTKMAPIEFIMCAYLIATKDSSEAEIAENIIKMRKKIRENFIDVRSNQRLYAFIKDYIDNKIE
ncbi:uncharacterized protein EV422DRAFT_530278 [Fimicolochytrium jonesii]|uniref:uncharacterized protein n=1 Tax=Fimicolochytrium jonesii TaxID=1396493 RepID=UPI0022FEEA51|nr:uncharacterized protein EV422DRAFT_530278 [Fimicolochytrium jonesii]KAI8820813.1 hypothetical protein EV422DRAFT_530278 [Fimicolochytrium jonesii]